MYIKKMKITSKVGIIRELRFTSGVNLIVDETPNDDKKMTGNNVGKTTVLKLIDFCLGGEPSGIYSDQENKKSKYELVKKYLVDNEVLVTLELMKNINSALSEEIVIERNFLVREKKILRINGENITNIKDFYKKLMILFFSEGDIKKPSFRQIISHNIRYKDDTIEQTLKTLKIAKDSDYEALNLYLLGLPINNGAEKQSIEIKIDQEKAYRKKLEEEYTLSKYEAMLSLVNRQIEDLEKKQLFIDKNANLKQYLDILREKRIKINSHCNDISSLDIRIGIIEEARADMEKEISKIDLEQLSLVYEEFTQYLGKTDIHKTFSDLVDYHNKMISEKIRFITEELPSAKQLIQKKKEELDILLKEEKVLSAKISSNSSFRDLDSIVSELNEKYRQKGEYDHAISQIHNTDNKISKLKEELEKITEKLYSEEFEQQIKEKMTKLNNYFSKISSILYGESYLLSVSKEKNKKTGNPIYKFNSFNQNMSSGKKQGEILCYDLAYIQFADNEGIPCLHFLLNDKKELVHNNQLKEVLDFTRRNNIQLIMSILSDKIPQEVLQNANIVVRLSQDDKLFRIEKNKANYIE